MLGDNEDSNLFGELTCSKLFGFLVVCTGISSAISTAAMAAGMETLKSAGHPGFTANNEALLAAAIGPMVITPAVFLLKLCGFESASNEQGSKEIIECVATVVLNTLVGYGILDAAGKIQDLSLGSAAAASAVGACEILPGLLVLICCCVAPCVLAAIEDNDDDSNTVTVRRSSSQIEKQQGAKNKQSTIASSAVVFSKGRNCQQDARAGELVVTGDVNLDLEEGGNPTA